MGPHSHTCAICGHRWSCDQQPCGVEQAAMVNRDGPWCALCLHLEMAKRYAAARGVELVIEARR